MHKIPRSVLVVIHTVALEVLLLERAPWPGYWQHTLADWGIENRYEIYREWRWKYAPGITHNVERVFGLTLPGRVEIALAPAEHARYLWLPWRQAAEKCFSWSNRDAILMLPERPADRAAMPLKS